MSQPRSKTSTTALTPHRIVALPPASETAVDPLLSPTTISHVNDVVLQPARRSEIAPINQKLPLPFEKIPGPAILKFIEKYWSYVPLLGTQVFCCLLINNFTVGTNPRVEINGFLFFLLHFARY